MPEPKRISSKPRPWSVPRLQGAIGNRAVHRILNPPPPPPPVEEPTAEIQIPEPEPAEVTTTRPNAWPPAILAAAVGAALGHVIELTPAASYAGPAMGLALGIVWFSLFKVTRR